MCWAGGVPTKTPLQGEWEQILSWLVVNPNGAAATSSASCSAAPPDAINHCKSVPYSEACGKSEPACLETQEEQWQVEVIRGPSPPSIE